jgi:asparagine synthase (glutamine-hydrolysing)
LFAGLISKGQPVSAWGSPDKILDALAPYSLDRPRDVWATERQMLVQVATRTGSTSADICRHSESGVAVAFWGRLDNRPDLIAQLDAADKASDDELIALAWLKWGEHSPEKLVGDFAFAIASPKTGVVFLARDVMGVKPLFYRVDEHGFFFANSAAAFKPLRLGTLTPSREWMARFMLGISFQDVGTAYEELKKLPGSHCLLVHSDGRMNLRRYHRFNFDAPVERKRDPAWLQAYQAVWQEAVACRMPEQGPIGSENSGGLDSGSITAELAKQLAEKRERHRLHGFGFAYAGLEPEYIMEVARHCEIANNYLKSGEIAEPAEGWNSKELRIAGYPNEHPNGTSHAAFYAECRLHGIGTLFSGFGGDEVTTLDGSALRLELYDRRDWRNLWDILPGAWPMRAGRFALTAYRALNELPTSIPGRKKRVDEYWTDNFVRAEMHGAYPLYQDYMACIANFRQFRTVNAHAAFNLEQAFIATRLSNCTQMAASYGVDYVWPLWDQRLVQQWLSTPSIWKMGPGGIKRNLHRNAAAAAGPDKMVWKPHKDMGYGQSLDGACAESNIALFEQLRGLVQDMPAELAAVVDADKARAFAEKGLTEDLRGVRYAVHLADCVSNLSQLSRWLRDAAS